MCDFVKRWFTPAGTGGQEAAAEAELSTARAAANAALLAQQQAIDQSTAASDSVSETARLAGEQRLRKLMAAGTFGAGTPSTAGAAPVATRQLFGG